jgi:hypothetical protein
MSRPVVSLQRVLSSGCSQASTYRNESVRRPKIKDALILKQENACTPTIGVLDMFHIHRHLATPKTSSVSSSPLKMRHRTRIAVLFIALISPQFAISAQLPFSLAQDEDCLTIRKQIGVVPLPHSMLSNVALRYEECKFTWWDVYRAAWGERPLPPKSTVELHDNPFPTEAQS